MLEFLNPFREMTTVSVILRMVMATLVGAVIGLERSAKNRPVGFRTHILVCLGAAVAMMTGLYVFPELKLPTDVSRLGAQVISGLGFIGAGTIANLKIHTLEGKGPSLYAAEVKVRGNTRQEPLTEHISQMSGVVNVAAL
ncbi:MAG: MgtC/SapB family protein [Clostridia bacterium]|nr:MgtC/SapB family protein [Clostridia bacterium]